MYKVIESECQDIDRTSGFTPHSIEFQLDDPIRFLIHTRKMIIDPLIFSDELSRQMAIEMNIATALIFIKR